jgi:ubiquinone/menaquinone biosynthesis C-methylase UbiE
MKGRKDHYSYAEYAKRETAENFERERFGGPIGTYMRWYQEEQLYRWISAVKGRSVLDVGAGTGRTSIPLARRGAKVVATDASQAMLDVAQQRAEEAGVGLVRKVCDAMDLPFEDRSFHTVLCFRVLMHVLEWRKALSEVCRCAGEEVIFDYPARWSLAALQVPVRAFAALFNKSVQNFRLFSLGQVRKELRRNGFEITEVDKLWVLPIAFHKLIGSVRFTRGTEKVLAGLGLRRLAGAPVTVRARRVGSMKGYQE